MNFEGNPFAWNFIEQRAIETLATRGNATYNTPRETVEQKTALDNFFEQNYGASPNPAHVTGMTAIDPEPFLMSSSSSSSDEENCDDDTTTGDESGNEGDDSGTGGDDSGNEGDETTDPTQDGEEDTTEPSEEGTN